jgi:hypothetical protein
MRRKIAIGGGILLVLIVLATLAAPVFAASPSNSPQPSAQGAQLGAKAPVLLRLLLVQDEAKVDALIANAENAGKITSEQAAKIKEFWTNNHSQFTKNVILRRLLQAKDATKVQAFLDKAEAAGKINADQAGKVMTLWNELHSK